MRIHSSNLSDYHRRRQEDADVVRETMVAARDAGLTYQEIGGVFGVSRQRVHQILTGYESMATQASRNDPEKSLRRKLTIKQIVLAHYGSGKVACVRCGFSDIRALSIDHINGDGWKDRNVRRGSNICYSLRSLGYPDGYQTLCMNCQFIKRSENGESAKRR